MDGYENPWLPSNYVAFFKTMEDWPQHRDLYVEVNQSFIFDPIKFNGPSR